MAPPKQNLKQSRGKNIVGELGEESHPKVVSEPGEGGKSSSPESADFAQFRKVQEQLCATVSKLSANFELLLQSRFDEIETREIRANREGIGTKSGRVLVDEIDEDEPLHGSHRNRQQQDHLWSSREGRCRDDPRQGFHRTFQQGEPSTPWGNRQENQFRGGREPVRRIVQEEVAQAAPNEDFLKGSKISFPKFDGTRDPISWFSRAEKFFRLHQISERLQVELATFHLEDDAQVWYDMLQEHQGTPSWPELKEAMNIQFGPSEYDDFYGDLTRLKQESSVQEFTAQFNRMITRAGYMTEKQKLSSYTCGLKPQLRKEVNVLVECCDNIDKALGSCSTTTGDIISTTERLKQELEIITQRQEIVSCFLRDYQLSIDEINALKGEEMNENFFKALSHVQQIHSNCKVLLRTHHQRAGLELMDMMAVYQEGAYERLCRWVQAECRRLGDGDNPDINDLLKTAVRCLRERPVLFKYCAEEVANMRHNALFRRFLTALTRGGPGGLPRPIEVHAHDPLRYVGDMLGWLHQALASERELVSVLLDPDAPTDTGLTATSSDSTKVETDMTSVLDRIFEGVCRPFKVRVEQVLQSLTNLTVSYKLSNTLEFYYYTISDLLGGETSLCKTLWLLKEAAQQTFFDNLKSRGDKLLRYPPLVSVDLSPPPAVIEGVSLLLEIIDTYNSMMVPASGKKPEFGPVITSLIDPIVQMCEQAAEAHKSKGAVQSLRRRRMRSDSAVLNRESSSVDALLLGSSASSSLGNNAETASIVFLVNCLSAIRQPLLNHDIAAGYAKNLGTMIERNVGILVEKEVNFILSRCGLLNKMSYVQKDAVWEKPLVEVEAMAPQMLLECLRKFFETVSGNEFGSLPEFEQMQIPHLRTETCVGVAKALADAYELVYNAVTDPKNQYPDPKSMARHPPSQIRTILGI